MDADWRLTEKRNLLPVQRLLIASRVTQEQSKHHLDGLRPLLNPNSFPSFFGLFVRGRVIGKSVRDKISLDSQAITYWDASDVKPVYDAGENSRARSKVESPDPYPTSCVDSVDVSLVWADQGGERLTHIRCLGCNRAARATFRQSKEAASAKSSFPLYSPHGQFCSDQS